MGIFAVLDTEEKIQLLDKTRFNAAKCFVAPLTVTAPTTLVIIPGLDGGTPLSVYDSADQNNWYLDWVFAAWTFDIVADFNDMIDFSQGSTLFEATLTPGTYTLATLMTEIAAAMNAVVGISGTFSASASSSDKVTISNNSSGFELLPAGVNLATSLIPHIGFPLAVNGSSVTGFRVEYSHKKILATVGNGTLTASLVKYMQLYSVAGDCLFSSDGDLQTWEPDIMNWVKGGRSSFLNMHREAQKQILYYLDKQGYTNVYQKKYTKFDIIDHSEVNEWSTFLTLAIIMWGISNKSDDIWLKKHFEFKTKASEARDRAVLRLDVNEDGQADIGEQIDIVSGTVVTR